MSEENAATALANSIPDIPVAPAPIAETAPEEPEPSMNVGPLESRPIPHAEDPAPRRAPARRKPPAPRASATVPKELKGIVPSADRVHVYKRNVNGKLAYTADYSSQEVAGCGTIEAFLKKYAVPKWGYGEFHLHIQKNGGALTPMGQVSIAEPRAAEKPTEISVIKELMEAKKRMEQDANRDSATAFDGMAKMMETLNSMQSGSGGNDMMPLMMMMMQQQQASRQPKSDPVIEVILRRLEAMENKASAPPPMPSMPALPPPPPPIDPMASMAPILASMLESNAQMNRMMMEIANRPAPVVPVPPQRDVLAEMAHMKNIFGDKGDSLGAREIIGLLPMVKEFIAPNSGPPPSLEEQIAEFRHMKEGLGELEREFRPASTNEGGFWDKAADILGGLIQNTDMGSKIAEGISKPPVQQAVTSREIPAETEKPKFEMPEGFEGFAKQINEADDIGHKIGAFVMGMQFLVKFETFRGPIMGIFTAIQKDEKTEALKMLDGFLTAFVENEVFTEKAAIALFEGVQIHWDMIRHKMGIGPAPETESPTQGPVPEPVSAAESTEAPEAEETTESTEAAEAEVIVLETEAENGEEIDEIEAAKISNAMNDQAEPRAQA